MKTLSISLILLTAIACTGTDGNGGQYGEEGAGSYCGVDERSALALDEASPGGFSANDLLDPALGDHEDTLMWADDTSSPLTATLSSDATAAAWLIRSWQSDDTSGQEPALAGDCPPVLEVEVTLALTTEDGRLADSWTFPLLATSGDNAEHYLQLEDLEGSLNPADFMPADVESDEIRAWLQLSLAGERLAGELSGDASGVDGDPDEPDSTAWNVGFEIGAWGAIAEE